ncbi:MAG: cyclic nucleotide-binding domain-containing protein [Elusimicrobia bacterium]|nr:cyclic nucleotide-binding domain-containing protein [Elusimicrobiota bacterium]
MEILPVDAECAFTLFTALKLDGFFPELTADEAKMLFPRSALEKHAAGSAVLKQGDPGRDLYIIHTGWVSVTQAFGTAAAELSSLGPGAIFGEMAMMRDGTRGANVVATTEAAIFRLAFADVQYLLKNNAKLGQHLQALATARS